MRNLQDICGPGSALQRFKQLPDLIIGGLRFGLACRKQLKKNKKKQEWAQEKPKLDNARKLSGINFVDPEDEECKETIKNAAKKLEVPMEAAMLCKMETRKRAWKLRGTVESEYTDPRKKTKNACIVEVHESTRRRLESTLPRNHEDHIAEKGFNSLTHFN